MSKHHASLSDKFDLDERRQLLTGTQAIVRLTLMQKARDKAAGLDTAGYVTGYRGSPIATLETAFERAGPVVRANGIVFQPGLNEDLAATAIWGSQQAELRGDGRHDGVFAIWYGKGPGVDRSGDAFRHANHAGTSRHGGVIALMGDDHTCESSTSAHQSEFAFVDAMMPILNPAGVQEIIDYGLLGFALSRYAGVWVGLKCVKDNIESTSSVDGSIDRVRIVVPGPEAFTLPEGGLNIRRVDAALAKEARLHDYKRGAVLAFARANALDHRIWDGGPRPRLGIVTAGKSYLDTREALSMLGIDEMRASELGLRLYKVAMSWPLEPRGIEGFAHGLDMILVVEEKRSLIETQLKEQLFDTADRPRVLGKKDEAGNWLFRANGALDPLDIAIAIGDRLVALSGEPQLAARVAELRAVKGLRPADPEAMTRIAHFCAGCPHNTSTVVPEGSRAYAGIGCHYMALWMDRSTEGFTQMGAEGANWIGEAPFSNRGHVFQNMGDGTYIHSGSLAIRAAVAANVNITFKLLYNDAVAMTGGQKLDGGVTVAQMAAQTLAEGVRRVVVVTDEPEKFRKGDLPAGVQVLHRRRLDGVQRDLARTEGVTVLIYDQTCAAEKRRRRKRGTYPDPARRVFINPDVCEGCGDCGVKSNCVAILPLETPFGRKREIDQSLCNKDFSCIEGFCPSFVVLEGAEVAPLKRVDIAAMDAVDDRLSRLMLPEPRLPGLGSPYAVLVTGVGGTGVVTVSAVLAQAAHIAGLGFGSIDVTGLAQKGGAVACHMRIAARREAIEAIRVGTARADLVLGGDLVVTASNKVLDTIRPDHTAVVYSPFELTTGQFARNRDLTVPGAALSTAIARRVASGALHKIDVHALSVGALGDSLYANMILLGAAYQLGFVPIAAPHIEEAIAMNGASVDQNKKAFRLGRQAAYDARSVEPLLAGSGEGRAAPMTLEAIIAHRAAHLADYQDEALAQRYRSRVEAIEKVERARVPGREDLARAVAHGYAKLLAPKDEYEVARLFTDGTFDRLVARTFKDVRRVEYHLAPPLVGRLFPDPATGQPRKLRFGPWLRPVLRMLAKGRRLRGTVWDVFGYTAERRMERQLVRDYEALLDELAERLDLENHSVAVRLAGLAEEIRGFGHVKAASLERVAGMRSDGLAQFRALVSARQPAAAE